MQKRLYNMTICSLPTNGIAYIAGQLIQVAQQNHGRGEKQPQVRTSLTDRSGPVQRGGEENPFPS